MSAGELTREPTDQPPRRRKRWPWVLLALVVIASVFLARPAWHLLTTARNDVDPPEQLPAGFADDASRMNRTPVHEVWPIPADRVEAEKQLAELLQRANRVGLRVSIAGARHSMGGHTIYPGGIVIDTLPFNEMELDEETNILHEYFVPPDGAARFVEALRTIIPRHDVDLLNVTVRSVDIDEDTFLRYADRQMFAFVLLFQQPRTKAGDAVMEAMTQELIEAALAAGGRYYLPYRLHATVEQFQRAYPQADRFFEFKRQYDPEELFQNGFYVKYAAAE